ncbi:hypothetical protein [Luteibacter anthropi]|uniref:Uncharacterized protein n=1 Tax=Luteibacter anthropi TaxID=564369 RepID=A0A7X5UB61_9GAMM|nr:hypothetical protein [Luteibacter anthropi]NII07228.1 hypothetical protein [Luteibacter anthropi]
MTHVQGALASASLESYARFKAIARAAKEMQSKTPGKTAPIYASLRDEPASKNFGMQIEALAAVETKCIDALAPLGRESVEEYRIRLDVCGSEVARVGKALEGALGFAVTIGGFRDSSWGDSMQSVVTKEGSPLVRRPNLVAYSTSVAGLKALAVFTFAADKLVAGAYVFTEEHRSDNSYLDDFDQASTLLRKKYGPTSPPERSWSDDLYKARRQDWGMAIATGRMSQYEGWLKDETDISHVVSGDNFKITHSIKYESRELKPLRDEATSKAQTKGL